MKVRNKQHQKTHKGERQGSPLVEGIAIKKQYGQHFLRWESVVDHMIDQWPLVESDGIIEIGCGDGFLTRALLSTKAHKVRIYEIDQEWAAYVSTLYGHDPRLEVIVANVLDVSADQLKNDAPWTLLANLPYAVTFPILHWLCRMRSFIPRGVFMVQEEVAQRLVATGGRSLGWISIYFQHYFEFSLLVKVGPQAFVPPPAVDSRLVAFSAKNNVEDLPESFWLFVRRCFSQPRRMLRNNLASYQYPLDAISSEIACLRAQQMNFSMLYALWKKLSSC